MSTHSIAVGSGVSFDSLQNGLVGWWPLYNSSSVYDIRDYSGNNNNGVNHGADVRNHGAYFTSSDYVDCGNVGTIARALSFWINPNSTTEVILEEIDNVGVSGSSGTLSYVSWDNCYVDGVDTDTFTIGWRHVVLTSTTNVDVSAFRLGLLDTTYFDGSISDVKIYDRALTTQEITALYNNENVPGAVLDMPLSKETQFKDISGNSNDGTNNGSRIDGYCAGFVTSSIQIPTTTTLDPGTGDFTYMCSFRSSNTTNDCRFYYSNWANNNSFIIWYRGSDVIEIGIKDNDGTQVGGDVTDNNNYMDGLWHGLTITFDRDGVVTGYIDGVKQTTTVDISSANADITTNSDISISSTNVSWGVDGDIKNVRIYNRVLPPSEITQLYENTKPYEIQLFNKEAVINNQQDYPQYWRKEINSPKQDYTNEAPTYWNISSASGEFNIDSIFTFSAENVWRRLFTEENYNSIGNLASIENAITYNSNRTNAEIATIATFFDNTTTSASIAEWLNRKEAIVTYDGEFGVFSNGYIATQSEAVNEWMDVSTENWHNLYPHTGSVIMSSSTLVFDASSSLKLMDDTYITDNYAMTSSWTIVATYTPQTSSGDMGLLYINGDVSIGVDILYKGGNYELAATVNPDSSSLNRLWTTLTNNIENVFVLTWDSGSYDCNFYNKSSNVWNSSSLNITSINHIDNTGSVSFNDGYSGSISEIRIYDSIKNFEQF